MLLAASAAATLFAQAAPKLAIAPPAETQASLIRALSGDWAGSMEYPAYPAFASGEIPEQKPDLSSEPGKRTQVPTWLNVTGTANSGADTLSMHFVYDEGPGHTSTHSLTIGLDVAASTFSITNPKGRKETYRVEGYESLHDGYGDLLLLGPFVDVHRPVGTHITLSIHRNSFTWYEENRASAATPFAFRHRYVFTRTQQPPVSAINPIH